MSRGGSFVIKENEFFYGEHSKTILQNRLRMYYSVIRRNEKMTMVLYVKMPLF